MDSLDSLDHSILPFKCIGTWTDASISYVFTWCNLSWRVLPIYTVSGHALYITIVLVIYFRKSRFGITSFATNCLISFSLISEPSLRIMNATGTSPASSSFILQLIQKNYFLDTKVIWTMWPNVISGFKCVGSTYETTAASLISGCVMRRASSSAGGTWKPLYLIISFSLSTMKISSSSST